MDEKGGDYEKYQNRVLSVVWGFLEGLWGFQQPDFKGSFLEGLFHAVSHYSGVVFADLVYLSELYRAGRLIGVFMGHSSWCLFHSDDRADNRDHRQTAA